MVTGFIMLNMFQSKIVVKVLSTFEVSCTTIAFLSAFADRLPDSHYICLWVVLALETTLIKYLE